MKLWMIVILLVCSSLPFANARVIYGDDDRRDLFEVKDPIHAEWARSTAAMFAPSDLRKDGGYYQVLGESLAEGKSVCEDQRFANQLAAASCSGFLVAEDLIVTAGHCVQGFFDCLNSRWVFGYSVDRPGDGEEFYIPEQNVYECKEVVSREYSDDNDYALIRLRRPVYDREPLPVRTSGKVEDGTKLVVIGHPTGLPTKVADGGKVKRNSNKNYFVANLDSFSGNSGSPVINEQSGVVEGILVRGEKDYNYVNAGDGHYCRVPNHCSNWLWGCKGEDSTRITNIKELLN